MAILAFSLLLLSIGGLLIGASGEDAGEDDGAESNELSGAQSNMNMNLLASGEHLDNTAPPTYDRFEDAPLSVSQSENIGVSIEQENVENFLGLKGAANGTANSDIETTTENATDQHVEAPDEVSNFHKPAITPTETTIVEHNPTGLPGAYVQFGSETAVSIDLDEVSFEHIHRIDIDVAYRFEADWSGSSERTDVVRSYSVLVSSNSAYPPTPSPTVAEIFDYAGLVVFDSNSFGDERPIITFDNGETRDTTFIYSEADAESTLASPHSTSNQETINRLFDFSRTLDIDVIGRPIASVQLMRLNYLGPVSEY
jgi:hypothetical protein